MSEWEDYIGEPIDLSPEEARIVLKWLEAYKKGAQKELELLEKRGAPQVEIAFRRWRIAVIDNDIGQLKATLQMRAISERAARHC